MIVIMGIPVDNVKELEQIFAGDASVGLSLEIPPNFANKSTIFLIS